MATAAQKKAAAAKAAAAQAQPAINTDLVKAIGEAMKSPAQCLFVPFDVSKPLVDAGLAIINVDYKDGAGNIATRLTDAGVAKTNEAPPAWGNAPVTAQPGTLPAGPAIVGSSFKLDTGIVVPVAKRGFGEKGGQGRKSIYPFADMEIGHSFFVAPTAEIPEPAKTLGSTVSSATLRYAKPVFNPDGTPKMTETMIAQRDAEGNIMTDGTGKILRQKAQVQEKEQTRKFVIRAIEENGVKGARIWRTA